MYTYICIYIYIYIGRERRLAAEDGPAGADRVRGHLRYVILWCTICDYSM